MRILLVDADDKRAITLTRELKSAGHKVIGRIADAYALIEGVARVRPDIIIIDMASPDRDTLESMRLLSRDDPSPIVMFAERSDPLTIRKAIQAGVSAYVVDQVSVERLQSVMQVAIARFEESQALRRELASAKAKLADRRDTDRAKGLLMNHHGMTETEAYQALRKLAMDRNLTIGEVARNLIAMAELLNPKKT
ncbi:MAG: ANTAR domain-containing response regulator [Thiotrichales bacterium]